MFVLVHMRQVKTVPPMNHRRYKCNVDVTQVLMQGSQYSIVCRGKKAVLELAVGYGNEDNVTGST